MLHCKKSKEHKKTYPQPGDVGGHRSAPAVCQSLTSADPTSNGTKWSKVYGGILHC